MLVEEVAALFLLYIDERDPTFFNAANRTTVLSLGYEMFRSKIGGVDGSIYEETVDLSFSNVDRYNLATGAVTILGTGALTGPRLRRIKSLSHVPTVATPYPPWQQRFLIPARSLEELYVDRSRNFYFGGTTIFLTDTFTGTLRLVYEPAPAVDWTKVAVGDNEPIDDIEQFHDLIALLAAQHYAAADGGWNAQLQALFDRRMGDLEVYLMTGRDNSSGQVAMVYDP